MHQLTTAESSAIRVFYSAESSFVTASLPERSSITFDSSITECVKALQEGSAIKDTEIHLANKTSPAQVTDTLITRGAIQSEQRSEMHQWILDHTSPLPILNRILALINEESRRANLMQEIEQQSAGYENKSLEQLRVLSAISTPESTRQFDVALEKYRSELRLHNAPNAKNAKELADILVRDLLNGEFSVSIDNLTVLRAFTDIDLNLNQINYQFNNVNSFLESLLKQGYIEANKIDEIKLSILVYNPTDTKRALHTLNLLLNEVQRRQDIVDNCSKVATENGLELSEEIYDSVNKLSCCVSEFFLLTINIDLQLKVMKEIQSPPIARWIPQSELEQIRQLPQTERISQSAEIIKQCKKLRPLEELTTSFNNINEDIIKLMAGNRTTTAEKLNAAKVELLEKLGNFDISSTCSASVRADLVALSEQLVELKNKAGCERSTMEHEKLMSDLDWQAQFNPM